MMSLFALGINHKTAPVEIREQVSIGPERVAGALQDLVAGSAVREAAILSTCNRTELYCGLNGDDGNLAVNWFRDYHHLSREDVRPYLYTYETQPTVRHVLRVASGLDSMVLGEPQILGQVKDAYRRAQQAGTIGKLLGRLFQHTFSVAKQVRTDTEIGSSPVSVAFAAVRLAQQIFDDLGEQTALLIGAGETIELAARHLHENQIGRMIVANRTLANAQRLAGEFEAYAIALSDLPAHLAEADIVISSTASKRPILDRDGVREAVRVRRHKPVLMVDIAVPRDIDPVVSELEDVYLYTVDDLQEVIAENRRSRQQAAAQAEEIIETEVSHFMGWLRAQEAVSTIRAYREAAAAAREEVLERAARFLARGGDPEEALQYLAHTLTNKLLHQPCVQMRQAGYQGRHDILEAAREVFGVNVDKDTT
jgi:glutamyl-tRNA reductase